MTFEIYRVIKCCNGLHELWIGVFLIYYFTQHINKEPMKVENNEENEKCLSPN